MSDIPEDPYADAPKVDEQLIAEQSVLGGMMLSTRATDDVIDTLRGTDFATPRHELIFDALTTLHAKGEPTDVVAVTDELIRIGELQRAGGADYLHTLTSIVPSAANAGYYAGIVAGVAQRRRVRAAAARALQIANDPTVPIEEVAESARAAFDDVDRQQSNSVDAIGDWYLDFLSSLEDKPSYTPTPWYDLNQLIYGFRDGGMYVIAADTGSGKALALDTPIPTPTGWTTMGALTVGDEVLGMDGKPTKVTFATEVQHDRECFEVVFSDGERIVADADHLWFTETFKARLARMHSRTWKRDTPWGVDQRWKSEKASVKTTREIAATVRVNADNRANHSIPLPSALDLPDAELPIDPYVFGYWLGDGNSRGALLHIWTQDSDHVMAELDRAGYYTSARPDGENTLSVRFSVSPIGQGGNTARDTCAKRLRDLGVICNKHVPDMYLRASARQRAEVLAGLLDSDGTINKTGHASIDVCSRPIAEGALELARSLGYMVSVTERRVNGRTEDTSICYRVRFRPRVGAGRLARKASRISTEPPRPMQRYITEVNRVSSVPVRCIQVDNAEHMYLAGRHMVPTHNTIVALQVARALAEHRPVMYVSLEMGREEIAARLAAQTGQVFLGHINQHRLTKTEWAAVTEHRAEIEKLPLVIVSSEDVSTVPQLRARVRAVKRRYGRNPVVVVDYLQLLTSTSVVENRQQEVAGFSRQLKLAAQQWNVPVIALSQLRRGQQGMRKGDPTLHDLRESGQIANDADVVLLLHRKPVRAAADELKVIVGKNRQGQTGEAVLVFQGQFARVLSKYQVTDQIDFQPRSGWEREGER